jgi:hypothetical protein
MRSALFFLLTAATASAQTPAPNTLTPAEAREGWMLLFDGQSTVGWAGIDKSVARDGRIDIGKDEVIWWSGDAPADFTLNVEMRGAANFFSGMRRTPKIPREFRNSGDKWESFTYTPTGKDVPMLFFGNGPGGQGAIRSVKLLPKNMTSLFNGKDLAGWRIFPGKKSKFDVKDGLLSIENGPGDLQTEGKYTNFLLQLECKTNGKHLNSGVFFRCREGEYQNGYEAQINNNFTASPPKDYLVESFDEKTQKKLEPIKIKSSAVDFGTGAIYRRIPATKDIAKDGEWFTLTILAHQNHFATWVNGIQTVDWHDFRPFNDNARNGYRKEGGHISLQGHDPTTNLSFRNIRIAELPN